MADDTSSSSIVHTDEDSLKLATSLRETENQFARQLEECINGTAPDVDPLTFITSCSARETLRVNAHEMEILRRKLEDVRAKEEELQDEEIKLERTAWRTRLDTLEGEYRSWLEEVQEKRLDFYRKLDINTVPSPLETFNAATIDFMITEEELKVAHRTYDPGSFNLEGPNKIETYQYLSEGLDRAEFHFSAYEAIFNFLERSRKHVPADIIVYSPEDEDAQRVKETHIQWVVRTRQSIRELFLDIHKEDEESDGEWLEFVEDTHGGDKVIARRTKDGIDP